MRSTFGLLGAIVVAALAGTSSAAIISLTDTVGDPASVVVVPGGSFDMQAALTLDSGESAIGTTLFLQASQSGIFTITGRTLNVANPFSDLQNSNTVVLGAAVAGLNPLNGADLGGTTPDLSAVGQGTYALYTFTISVSPSATGSYTITVGNTDYSDADFNTFSLGSTTYTVSVPEPMALGLMGIVSSGLLLRRRVRVA